MAVLIDLIENQTMKHITFIPSQTNRHLYPTNFQGSLKSTDQSYHHQKVYFTKQNHIISHVSPTVDVTKN